MAIYAIGDVQGCFDELMALLDKINFDTRNDQLWFAGDLVNRGPKSLQTLRFVKDLGDAAVTVLGNHDLHMIAIAQGLREQTCKDNISDVLNAPDRNELFNWVRKLSLLHHDERLGYTMVHAGLPPQWDLAMAQSCAAEVEAVLQADDYPLFISQMYGDEPDCWPVDLSGVDRWRFIINSFTRLRFCDAEGRLVLSEKGAPGSQAKGIFPWFDVPGRRSAEMKIIFGHWSTLGQHGQLDQHGLYALDTGCIWGGSLTAMRLDCKKPEWVNIQCKAQCDFSEK